MNTKNKIALVTGGSRGLGRNIALTLAKNGADVVLTYRREEAEGRAVLAEIEQLGRKGALLQIDVADIASFGAFSESLRKTLREELGRATFDFLINNAGIDSAAPFAEMTEENFDRLFLVHFKGVYFLTQKLLPLLADGGASSILRPDLPGSPFLGIPPTLR
jgi:NAD(P)-dependent dehydrogenase (short-subunit alcohol dehydrogenase family)